MKRRSTLQLLGLTLAAAAGGTLAQPGSGRQLRLIVPNPAGSATDHVARTISGPVGAILGQTIVVDNKAGANGVIAMQDLVKSAPDGNTLMIGSLSPLAINVALMKNLPYDPRRDVTPIAGAYLSGQVLMVKTASAIRTFPEFIAHAKQNPGKVSIAYASSLSQAQLGAMAKQADIDVLPVPYKGIPAAINDVIGGNVDATFVDTVNAQAQVKSGHMRALAVASGKRTPVVPDWPSISETLKGYDFSGWTAIVGPRGMPRDMVNRINAAFTTVMKQKDVVDKLATIGFVPWFQTPDELKGLIESDITRWTRLAADHKITME